MKNPGRIPRPFSLAGAGAGARQMPKNRPGPGRGRDPGRALGTLSSHPALYAVCAQLCHIRDSPDWPSWHTQHVLQHTHSLCTLNVVS